MARPVTFFTGRWAAMPAVYLALVAAPAFGQTMLAYKFKKGDKLNYTFTTTTKGVAGVPGREILTEHPREEVTTGARELVRDQRLRAGNAADRQLHTRNARDIIGDTANRLATHGRHEVVVEQPAAVEALVDHRALAVLLREVVPVERGDGRAARVRHPDVGERPVGERVHTASVVLDPRALPQLRLRRAPARPSRSTRPRRSRGRSAGAPSDARRCRRAPSTARRAWSPARRSPRAGSRRRAP